MTTSSGVRHGALLQQQWLKQRQLKPCVSKVSGLPRLRYDSMGWGCGTTRGREKSPLGRPEQAIQLGGCLLSQVQREEVRRKKT